MSKESAMKLASGGITPVAPTIAVVPPADPPAGDPPAADPGAPPAADDKLSIFVKKEAQLFREKEAIKKEREEFQRKQKEYDDKKAEYDRVISLGGQYNELVKTDKVKALKLLGWTDADIINLMADKPAVDPVEEARRLVDEKTKELDAKWEAKEKTAQEEDDKKLINNFKADITKTIKDNAEKFEFCAYEGKEAELQAYHIIQENLKVNGELLTIEEALTITEELYEERYKKAQGLKKLKSAEASEVAASTEPSTSAEVQRGALAGKPPVSNTPAPKPRTLTNAVAPTTPAATPTGRRETHQEKKERLANIIRTQGLKK